MSYKLNKIDCDKHITMISSIINRRTFILDIDYREQIIINLLKERGVLEEQPISEDKIINYDTNNNISNNISNNINIKNLIIGDFILREACEKKSTDKLEKQDINSDENDEESHTSAVHYIIERKTVNDLCSSIKDGRFLEQKNRLVDTIDDPNKIIYIIEGDRNKISPIHGIPKSTLNSAIQNLIFKHNYKVIFTDSPEETIDNILLLYKKLISNEFESKGTSIKPIKKSDKLNENVFMNMLCAIPGISIKTAKMICYKYKNMHELVQAYNLEPDYDSKLSLLSNIVLSEKRKIGISLSTRIYKSLFEIIQNNPLKTSQNKKNNHNIKRNTTIKENINYNTKETSNSINKEICLL